MILLDTTVLSNYALVDQLHRLRLFARGRALATDVVLAEFEEGIARNLFSSPDITWIRRTRIRGGEEGRLFQRFSMRLGAGEASCLAVAIQRKHDFLTDDMDARKAALREGVRVSGSVGVLVNLINRELIHLEEGNRILRDFIASGYFSPVEKLDELLS